MLSNFMNWSDYAASVTYCVTRRDKTSVYSKKIRCMHKAGVHRPTLSCSAALSNERN